MAGELHQKLVAAAARWLESARRCCLVATDIVTACGETPDAIGWYGTHSILVECKASLADFRRDATKPSRQRGGSRTSLGSLRYYFAPKGIIPPAAVPEGWGLLEMQESGRISVTIEAGWMESDRPSEVAFLLSVIRRMGPSPLKGMGVKFYTLEGKRNGTVGIEPIENQNENIEHRRS